MSEKMKSLFSKFKILRSLKLRLFIIIFLVGILPSTVIYFGILSNYEERAIKVRTSDVQNQLKIIANHLITYNYLQDSSSEVINAELEQLSNLYNGRVMIINGNLKIVKDTYGISEGKTIISEEVIKCFKGTNTANYDRVNGFIEITVPIVETVSNQNQTEDLPEGTEIVRGVMLTSVSTDTIQATLVILNRKTLIIAMIMVSCILVLAGILSRILILPFDRVSNAISEVQEGYTNEPISVPDYIETEHIIDAFNSVLQRMKVLDDSRQEFVANKSLPLTTSLISAILLLLVSGLSIFKVTSACKASGNNLSNFPTFSFTKFCNFSSGENFTALITTFIMTSFLFLSFRSYVRELLSLCMNCLSV